MNRLKRLKARIDEAAARVVESQIRSRRVAAELEAERRRLLLERWLVDLKHRLEG